MTETEIYDVTLQREILSREQLARLTTKQLEYLRQQRLARLGEAERRMSELEKSAAEWWPDLNWNLNTIPNPVIRHHAKEAAAVCERFAYAIDQAERIEGPMRIERAKKDEEKWIVITALFVGVTIILLVRHFTLSGRH